LAPCLGASAATYARADAPLSPWAQPDPAPTGAPVVDGANAPPPAPPTSPGGPPVPAPKQDAHPLSLSLRSGWALPIGDLASGETVKSNYRGMAPLGVEVTYRLDPSIAVGAYFQWSWVSVNPEVCSAPLSCSAQNLRFGASVFWHPRPPRSQREPLWPG